MEEEGFVVRLRGLPWSTTQDDVVKFFDGCQIKGGKSGIYLTMSKEGRPSGHGFVELSSEDDLQRALKKDREHLGSRYIEVFRCKKSEMEWVVKRGGMDNNSLADAIVKLRGLPFGCSKEEIAQFFTGLEIVPNGIMLPEDRLGRSTGEAFVQFASQDIAERALGKHKERIGHRYIEIFKSCLAEANAVTNRDRGFRSMGRPGPYDRGDRFGRGGMGFSRGRGGRNVKGFFDDDGDSYNGGGFGYGGGRGGRYGMMDNRGSGSSGNQYMSRTGHSVHMRGLPFQAQEQDVFDFFSPIQPVRVTFEYSSNGRPSGKANVDFATHQEALEAMKKHKSNMQHRYIELFLNSATSNSSSQDDGYIGSGMGMNSGYGGGNMGGGNEGFDSGAMGGGFNNNMDGGGGMGGYYDSQGVGQYSSSNMGGSGFMGGGGQRSDYGNQGVTDGYNMEGGSSGGYSSMGSNTMGNLANPGYTAF